MVYQDLGLDAMVVRVCMETRIKVNDDDIMLNLIRNILQIMSTLIVVRKGIRKKDYPKLAQKKGKVGLNSKCCTRWK